MTASIRAGGAAVGLLSLAVLAGCGGSSGGNASSSSSAGAIDPCLVNTWMSTKVTGTLNGQAAQISGGTGEKVTFSSDGTVNVDDSGVSAMNITAGGQSAVIKSTGQGSGKATTSGGNKLVVTLSSNSLSQQFYDPSGAPQGTPQAAPGTVNDTYTCSANQELSLTTTQTGGDVTTTYQPASSGSGGSSTESGSASSGGSGSSTDTGSSSSTATGSSSSST